MKLEYFSLQWQEKIPGIPVQLESKEKLAACVPEFPELETAQYSRPQSPPFSQAGLARAMPCASALCSIILFDCMCMK